MLNIKKVSKSFNSKKAVCNISFSVKTGEIVSLIGPNGSGKTTLIKLITGLLEPSHGKILVRGKNVVEEPEKTKAMIGYIPDEPAIWPFMTGGEFISFTQALYEIPEETREKAIPGLLAKFDLAGIEKEYFEEYSRGNKQKFSILAALAHKPKLLLIDEPIVGLDPISATTACEEFQKFAKDGGSVLLVTHTLSVAASISDRIGVLHHGKLLALGTLAALQKKAGLTTKASLDDIYKKLLA